jgi:ABC-type polysaccharide/polyol phosphate export permease
MLITNYQKYINYFSIIHAIAIFSSKREAQHPKIGILLIYIKNLALLLTMWAVFTYGLKVKLPGGGEYFDYFAPGYVVWTFFSEIVLTSSSFVKQNKFICENTTIKITSLMVANVYKNLMVNLMLLITIMMISGTFLSLNFEKVMLIISGYFLAILIALFFSTLSIFMGLLKGALEIYIPVLISLLFWGTPIVWNVSALPDSISKIAVLNPLFIMAAAVRSGYSYQDLNLSLSSLYACIFFFLILVLSIFKVMNKYSVAILGKIR